MLYYTLSNILLIENKFIDNSNSFIDHSANSISSLSDETINILYTIEYKFKERKQYKSKYTNPKPISFSDIRLNLNKLSKGLNLKNIRSDTIKQLSPTQCRHQLRY